MSNKNEFVEQFRVLAGRFEGEGPDEQLRTIQQAGQLAERAIECGYLKSDSFPRRVPGPNPGIFPNAPGYLSLDPHVRWLHHIADRLADDGTAFVRPEPGGMTRIDTTGTVAAAITTWRHRGKTMSEVMRRLANMIGDDGHAETASTPTKGRTKKLPPPPTREQWQAWELKNWGHFGQEEILKKMVAAGVPVTSQSTISRWIGKADEFLAAGGTPPSYPEGQPPVPGGPRQKAP